MRTVFKGQDRFEQLVLRAKAENWKALPIGQRTAAVGQAMVGTPYRSFTLEIDNRVESPSVNFTGLDCWTFFETALAFARMLDEPETNWTPAQLLRYIEIDRYRHAECTGDYLSRLHYLEDWLYDNDRRGLVSDLTRSLGGVSVPHSAREMTNGWRHYRYLVHNRGLLRPLAEMEAEVSSRLLYEIPKVVWLRSNRDCAVATSSALSRATAATVRFARRRTLVWHCVVPTVPSTSCTPPRRIITAE